MFNALLTGRYASFALALLLLTPTVNAAPPAMPKPPAAGLTLYVDPAGRDDANGVSPRTALATPGRAVEKLRTLRTAGKLPAGSVVIELGQGTYRLTDSLALTAADSGSAESPVIFRAAAGQTVRLSGAAELKPDALKPVTDAAMLDRLDPAARGKVRQVDLAALGITHAGPFPNVFNGRGGIFELFLNGRRLPLSRWPNEGTTTMKTVVENGEKNVPGAFIYRDDRPARWTKNPNVWLKGQWRVGWEDPAIKVASIDTATKTIRFAAGISLGIGNKYTRPAGNGKEPWYALNLPEEIDAPGEWAIDFASKKLYLWPPDDAAEKSIFVSQLDKPLVKITDTKYVRFEGITFDTSLAEGVTIRNGNNVFLAGCEFENLGGTAVVLNGTNCGVVSCDMHDIGEGCIELSGGDLATLTPSNNLITNNHLHHYGVLKAQYSPAVNTGYGPNVSVGATISHNRIHHAPRDAFLVGGADNTYEYNDVYACGYDTADTGAFYSWSDWTIRNIVVRYNYIHDTVGGINPDDGASGFVVYGNVFAGPRVGWWIASGPDHVFEHNVLIKDEGPAFAMDDRGVSRKYATNKRMIAAVQKVTGPGSPWLERFPTMAGMLDNRPDLPWRIRVAENILVVKKGDAYALKMSKENQKLPGLLDWKNNFVTATDPGFVNAAAGNFTLKPSSPALKQLPKFPQIPWQQFGLYVDEYRKTLPKADPKEENPLNRQAEKNFGT